MKVKKLFETPLCYVASGIRMSHNNGHLSDSIDEKIGENDVALVKRVGAKLKHESVLEFSTFIFEINGISRALLQELARHRLASLTVKSTRYTLNKELKSDQDLFTVEGIPTKFAQNIAEKACVYPKDLTEEQRICQVISNAFALASIGMALREGVSNDKVKYMLPESYKTSLQFSINLRSFINMYNLRRAKSALPEFQELVKKMFETLSPEVQEVINTYNEKD